MNQFLLENAEEKINLQNQRNRLNLNKSNIFLIHMNSSLIFLYFQFFLIFNCPRISFSPLFFPKTFSILWISSYLCFLHLFVSPKLWMMLNAHNFVTWILCQQTNLHIATISQNHSNMDNRGKVKSWRLCSNWF